MKRILYIATSDITKRTGGGIANLSMLNSLIRRYGDIIDVLHYGECLKPPIQDNFILVPPMSKLNKLKSFLSGRIHRFYPWLDEFLNKYAGKYTHCIINTGILGDYIIKLHSYGIRVAVVHHNYEVEFQLDNKRPSTFYGITGHFVSKSERASYMESDMNLFLSADDMKIFHEKYSNSSSVPEYVVGIFEPDDFIPHIDPNRSLSSNRLAICGSLNSIQTIRGIRHFKENCLAVLETEYSGNYKLRIAGRNPGKEIIILASNNSKIEIIPNPLIMSDVLKDCGIFICPTNVGGGIKLRILDGLKMGMPILTHEVSARGYNNLHGYDWFQMYSDQESFTRGLSKIRNAINHKPYLRKEILNAYTSLFSVPKGEAIFLKAIDTFLKS